MLTRATVTMYIEKFGKVVTIEADHPLALAQYKLNAEGKSKAGKHAPKSEFEATNGVTPPVRVSKGTVSDKSVEELESLSKAELVELAASLDITVVSSKKGKKPSPADHVAALSAPAE